MCTSPTTVYSCGHTKPDHIIEFCYADDEGDCGQIHTRFEHLPRKCPGCMRRAHDELEHKRRVSSHDDEDDDVAPLSLAADAASPPSSSTSPRSTFPYSPKGECSPAAEETATKVGRQSSAVTTTEADAATSPQCKPIRSSPMRERCGDDIGRENAALGADVNGESSRGNRVSVLMPQNVLLCWRR
ncbi:spry domain-containing [Diplodia corticola]|uniref:Spry domain-containing n=1 Tax=Diplodia corticola TaxID=236234 RepID=A0A1J9RWV9_9PEZI|nr:spry domain-containing [Diplodia corticola]OJD37123.1 spry domain-containing [Diplodia corticola]